MKHFGVSFLFSIISAAVAFFWGFTKGASIELGLSAVMLVAILAVMEVSLSFDNAVVNASILKHWSAFWKKLFLTIGMIIAVFGMRLLFPLLIVSVTAGMGLVDVAKLALHDPQQYSQHLMAHHIEISAFGGMFLLLVFLNFVLDANKDVHWFRWLEKQLSQLGRSSTAAILMSLLILIASMKLIPEAEQFKAFMAGIWGIVVYLSVHLLSSLLEGESHDEDHPDIASAIHRGGVAGFVYLEVLDAAFSFDGVIGAFAITSDVVIIMLGLAVGAFFVRSLTLYLVDKGTLDEFVFLEHGAHYAIGALAVIMLLSMHLHIPELVTGLIGVAFIGWSLLSSISHRKKAAV